MIKLRTRSRSLKYLLASGHAHEGIERCRGLGAAGLGYGGHPPLGLQLPLECQLTFVAIIVRVAIDLEIDQQIEASFVNYRSE